MEILNQNDRVSYSYGFKKSDNNYGSKDFHFSYSTDRQSHETTDQAFERAKSVVRAAVSQITSSLEHTQKTLSAVAPPQNHAPTVAPNTGSGGYVITFGKHKGKTLSQIEHKSIQGTLDWIAEQEKPGKNLKEYKKHAVSFLGMFTGPPQLDQGEEIPF